MGEEFEYEHAPEIFEIEVDQNGVPLLTEDRVNNKLFTGGEIDLGIKGKRTLEPLKINGNEYAMAQQGNYPVILLNLKDVKGSSYQEIEAKIQIQIIKLFEQHRYLGQYCQGNTKLLSSIQKKQLEKYFSGNINKLDIETSLCFLSELLFKHFNQKVYRANPI